jgi:hypothetical protein
MMQDQMANRYTISTPALLQGIRCFIDASTSPDQPSLILRQAGLGILIVNTEAPTTQTGYIKARLTACSSVLMAEAAALALAVNVTHHMNLTNINFLSDCDQLVQFLNAADHSNPPDWRIKYFTHCSPTNQLAGTLTYPQDQHAFKHHGEYTSSSGPIRLSFSGYRFSVSLLL